MMGAMMQEKMAKSDLKLTERLTLPNFCYRNI
jgi:hypothetical protein